MVAYVGKITPFFWASFLFLTGCGGVWNSPYSDDHTEEKIFYDSFTAPPKYLDPARSFSSDEFLFLENIYEPPLQYHYLKRPYELIPLTAEKLPVVQLVSEGGQQIYLYDITIKPNIFYSPHPAFSGKRELVAEDYVYQIKRLADPAVQSPIAALMKRYIQGFSELGETLRGAENSNLHELNLPGARAISRYRYQIRLTEQYPQFMYWLAMPFFAPMPSEVLQWYDTRQRAAENINTLPIGTGPFAMTEYNPNYRITLQRNPYYREDFFPSDNADVSLPLKRIPFLDRVVYTLEKETIPHWQKFLQGYYDSSGVSSDNFDQAISLSTGGQFQISEDFEARNIQLKGLVMPTIYYLGFNMLDPAVGGYDVARQKLRQAISIALDYEEYVGIFANGRGVVAHGPIPPGIFGFDAELSAINPWVFTVKDGLAKRKSLDYAKQLLSDAGYPGGIDPNTGESLRLNYEGVGTSAGGKDTFNWMRRQFAKIGINLNVRLTDYNRFREKIEKGQGQLFYWGWSADYPDPENFLFLLYGDNGKVNHGGENVSNYKNVAYDALFEKMSLLENGPERAALIQKMVTIVREDSPWVWGWHPKAVGLYHQWVENVVPITVSKNTLKYRDVNVDLRASKIADWNRPALLPLMVIFFLIGVLVLAVFWAVAKQKKIRYKWLK